MHIAEGVLAAPVLAAGGALAAAGCAVGLRRLDESRLMPAALLSAAFFTASLITVPIGPSSVHPLLNGLTGALLGWAAFPAITVALLLQALLFQYGGLTSLGVNAWNVALPAVLAGVIARPWLAREGRAGLIAAFCCGAGGVLGAALFTAASLALTDEGFVNAAKILVLAHLPVSLAEGFLTVAAVAFLRKARPEFLRMAFADAALKGDAP